MLTMVNYSNKLYVFWFSFSDLSFYLFSTTFPKFLQKS